jgi:hypothetical protein
VAGLVDAQVDVADGFGRKHVSLEPKRVTPPQQHHGRLSIGGRLSGMLRIAVPAEPIFRVDGGAVPDAGYSGNLVAGLTAKGEALLE